jgi:hypothetical protein
MVTQYIVNFTDPETTAFTVNPFTTDGPVAPNTLELSSTAVRANTSLLIYGKGHPDYGERIGENLINIMENFSGATAPQYPISGQAWFARLTYVFVGLGSPAVANVYRWEDDSTEANGGRWVTLTNTGAVDPTVADEVKTSGTTPTTVVDGAFYLDTNGSPLVPELYIGVNNSSSNMSATWLKREVEDLTGLVGDGGQFISQIGGSPELREYLPQKQLKIYDGIQWKNSGNVYSSHVPPQSPAIGDMWYQLGAVGSPPAGSPTLGGGGGPLSQLFIWGRPGPGKAPRWLTTGYLDRQGDTMTGPLYFGLPTPSLALWEGGGSTTLAPDIRMTGDGLISVTPSGVGDGSLYVHINDTGSDNNAGNEVFEVASNSQTRNAGTFTSLFQVRTDGIIRSALPWGSPGGGLGSPNTYKTLLLNTADDNALINKAYVDDVIATVGTLTVQVNENTTNIEKLAGSPLGSPILGKVNRTGDTMTGTLTFQFGSPQASFIGINMGDLRIANVQTPQAPEDAVNRQYVDDLTSALGSPIGADEYVTGGSWDGASKTLTLTRNIGSDLNISFVPLGVEDTDVSHSVSTKYIRDTFQETYYGSPLFGSPVTSFPLTVTQNQINTIAIEDINLRLANIELPFAREIFRVGVGSPLALGGSPVDTGQIFSFTDNQFVAGTNRLLVFVNGVKQYANERARQSIRFSTRTALLLSSTSRTLLNDDSTTYTLQVAVDGGSPIQTLSAPGNSLQIFQDIVDEINTQIIGATAVWNFVDTAIDVYSDTTGTGSQINIIDAGSPIGSTILGALATTPRITGSPIPGGPGSPNTGSPNVYNPNVYAYTIGNIAPVAGGPISSIIRNLAYYEGSTGSPSLTEATFGQISDTVVFNTALQAADTLELLYESVKE